MEDNKLKGAFDVMSSTLELGEYETFKKQLESDSAFREGFFSEASKVLDLGDYKSFDASFKKKDGGKVSEKSPLPSASPSIDPPSLRDMAKQFRQPQASDAPSTTQRIQTNIKAQDKAQGNVTVLPTPEKHSQEVQAAKQKISTTLQNSDKILERIIREDRVAQLERQSGPGLDGMPMPALQTAKKDLITKVPVTQEEVAAKKNELLTDDNIARKVIKRSAKQDPTLAKSLYLVDAETRVTDNPDRVGAILDNARRIEAGELRYNINRGILEKPENFIESGIRGIKERSRQMDDYKFFTETKNDDAIISQLEADMKDYDPDRPVPVADGGTSQFTQMLGMEGIPMLKSSAAAIVTGVIPGAQAAVPLVAAAASAPEYYKRGYASAFREVYYDQRKKGKDEREALAVARKQAESEGNLSAAEGALSSAIGARMGFKPTSIVNSPGLKNALTNVVKVGGNFIKENLPEGAVDASVAGVLQIAKNIEAINNGINRDVLDGVDENVAGELLFTIGVGGLTQAGRTVLNPETYNTLRTYVARQPKEVVDAKLGELVLTGQVTPTKAKEIISEVDKTREADAKIPDDVQDVAVRAEIQTKIEQREGLKAKLATVDEVFHAPIKEQIKSIDQEILNLSNATTKSQIQEGITEGDIRQPQGVVQGQPEIGQGERQQGQAEIPQANVGDSNIGSSGAVITLAPFFNTTVTNTQDAARLRQTPEYKAYIESIPKVANELGIEVDTINETIGGFENAQGEKIIEISNRVFLKNSTVEQAERFASIMGTMTPETQEATIAAKYITEEDAPNVSPDEYVEELTVKVDDLNGAIDSLKNAGIYDFTIDQDAGTISFLDFSKGTDVEFDNKIANFVEDLASKNINYGENSRRPVQSRYISPERRAQVLAEIENNAAGLQQGGGNLRSIIAQAKQRDEAFRNKGQEVVSQKVKDITGVAKKLATKFQKISPDTKVVVDNYQGLTRQLLADNKISNELYSIAQRSKGFFEPTTNTVYLNPERFSNDTPIHEFGHVWFGLVKKFKPELYKRGMELAQDVKLSDAYSNLNSEEAKEEYLVDLIGKKGVDLANRPALAQWLKDVINFIKSKIGGKRDFKDISLDEFIKLAAEDVVSGGVVTGLKNAAENPESSVGQDVDIEIKPNTGRSPIRGSWLTDADIVNVEDLAGTKVSRVVFYDNTRVGKFDVKNIKTGYTPDFNGMGGFGYSYIPGVQENNMILAFTSIGQAIQTLKRHNQNPESIIGVAMQNQQTAHLGNLDTNRILFDPEQGIFQNAAKSKSQEREILSTIKESIAKLTKLNSKEAKDVEKVAGALKNIKTLNEFYSDFMLGVANSFSLRSTILKHLLQDKQTKITAATREDHRVLHYKYGVPTKADIAAGINEKIFENAELGDVVKYVKPSEEKVIYTTDEAIYNQYSNNPTPEMISNGITIELLPAELSHISYPIVIKGVNVGVGDTYVNAVDLFPNLKERGIEKKQSFYPVGRMTLDAPAGVVPEGAEPQGTPLKFQVDDLEIIDGFYSPIEKRVKEFKQPKASATKWKEIVGMKSDEAVFSGLADWLGGMKPDRQLSKEEVLKFMKDNRIEIREVEISDPSEADIEAFMNDEAGEGYTREEAIEYLRNEEGATKYSQYQLPGGEDYKEILITLPKNPDPKYRVFDESRFEVKTTKDNQFTGQRDVELYYDGDLVGQRYGTRVSDEELIDDAKKRFLTQDEQDAKKASIMFKSSHFDEPNIITHLRMNTRTDADGKKVLFLEEVQSDWGQKGKREGFGDGKFIFTEQDQARYRKLLEKATLTVEEKDELDTLSDKKEKHSKSVSSVPSAPYVTNTNAWVKLGLKVALKEAVRQGADRIAWTTGDQQNERYDLSKQVDEIDAKRNKDGSYEVTATKDGSSIFGRSDMSIKDIEDTFGKDVAEKIDSSESRLINISGDNLKAGGKGMKAFYGDAKNPGIVANVAKALVKELTGKEGQITPSKIYSPRNQDAIDRYNRARQYGNVPEALAKEYEQAQGLDSEQPAIEVTPELRQSVQGGMPKFQVDESALRADGEGKERDRALSSRFGSLSPETIAKIDDDAATYFQRPNKQTEKAVEEFLDGVNVIDAADYVLSNPDIPEVSKVWMAATVAKKLGDEIATAKTNNDTALVDALASKQADIYNEFAKKATSLGQAVQAFIAFRNDPNAVEFFLPKILRQLKKAGVEDVTEEQKADIIAGLRKVNEAKPGLPKDKAIIELSHYLAGISPMKPIDVLKALWYAKILSGVTTQATNFFANVFNTMFELPAVGLRIAIKSGNPLAVIYGMKGFGSGVAKGAVAAADIIKSGVRSKEADKYFSDSPLEYFTWSKWLGEKGKVLDKIPPLNFSAWKYVGRILAATDALFSTANEEAIANMLAYAETDGKPSTAKFRQVNELLGNTKENILAAKKQALREGFKRNSVQWKRRVIEIVAQKRDAEIESEADAIGKRITMNYDPEGFTKPIFDAVVGLQRNLPPIKMIIPFARIVANLTENALNYTPAGLARAISGKRNPFSTEKGQLTTNERIDLMSKFAIGVGALAILATKVGDDEDDWFDITAAGSNEPEKKYELMKGGWRPYTITFKDGTQLNYKDWPIAGILAGMGNIRDAKKYSAGDETSTALAAYGFFLNFYDKSLLSGLSDFFGIFEVKAGRGKYSPDTKASERASKWAAQQVRSVAVSNLAQQTGKLYSELVTGDPQRDAKTFAEVMYRDLPMFNDGIRPIIDVFGEPVKYNTTERLTPIMDPESDKLIKWLNENKLWVGAPKKRNIFDMSTATERPMTDEEYYEYRKLTGQKTKDWIKSMMPIIKNDNRMISEKVFDKAKKTASDLAYVEILMKANK